MWSRHSRLSEREEGDRGRNEVAAGVLAALLCVVPAAAAAQSAPGAVTTLRVSPEAVAPGRRPEIALEVFLPRETRGPEAVSIVASVIRPDTVLTSWLWKNIVVAPGERKTIALAGDYDTKRAGVYKAEFAVYSADMRRRLHVRSKTFRVIDISAPDRASPTLRRPEQEPRIFGAGAWGNALNPGAGATLVAWFTPNAGIQGCVTAGTFVSREVRLLLRITRPSGFNPYAGAGFLHVEKSADIIGEPVVFEDDSVSGAAGLEIPLGSRWKGYVELSGSGINLKKTVSNGVSTVDAAVTYAPLTFGAGVVLYLF